jgi:3-dehydroquinate synthase
METITVALAERSYPIYIGTGLLDNAELYLPHLPQKKAAIITNETVAPLYLDRVANALRAAGVEIVPIVVPDGEKHKNWQTLNSVFDALLANHCERKTTVIALGGGVVGDLAGFAAASYLRGVPFIQVPTTLLAQVDSSVGGKTGINHALGKNMIGAFYQPRAVIADTSTLNTLPDRELSAGLAEVIKYGLIRDLPFFEWLEANVAKLLVRDSLALAYAVKRSCENKAEVVAADEREEGLRAILNFGHTFGHAIETATDYEKWLHGEAVAQGMTIATAICRELAALSESDELRVRKLLSSAALPANPSGVTVKDVLAHVQSDKKKDSGSINYVLLNRIGQAYSSKLPEATVRRVLETILH